MAIPANCGVNSGSTQFVGIAASTTTAGNIGDVVVSGTVVATATVSPEVTAGPVYLSTGNGQLLSTAPSASEMLFSK